MTKPLRIALAGATGRMGRLLTHAITDSDDMVLVAVTASHDNPRNLIDTYPDVIIDFTTPLASLAHARLAAVAGIPMVLGTTGHNKTQTNMLRKIAQKIPLVFCANTSVGVTVLADLVAQVAQSLGPSDWDIEIVETHHRHKVDAPSGTALMLGGAAARGRQTPLDSVAVLGRTTEDGTRATGAIGFASIRGGDVAGEHRVIFYGAGEQVELTHRATDRAIFARGALRAARWVVGKKPGLYSMQSVLK